MVKTRAFSMLETLLASILFSTVMTFMMAVWVTHAKAIDKSQDQQVAGALAQRIMEMQRARGFQATNVTSQSFQIERTMRGVTQEATFWYSVYVNDGPSVNGPTYKNVLVRVAWEDQTGNHTLDVESNAGW